MMPMMVVDVLASAEEGVVKQLSFGGLPMNLQQLERLFMLVNQRNVVKVRVGLG